MNYIRVQVHQSCYYVSLNVLLFDLDSILGAVLMFGCKYWIFIIPEDILVPCILVGKAKVMLDMVCLIIQELQNVAGRNESQSIE